MDKVLCPWCGNEMEIEEALDCPIYRTVDVEFWAGVPDPHNPYLIAGCLK